MQRQVAVLKEPVKAGDELVKGSFSLRAAQDIAGGHKIAVEAIAAGAPVRKYGQVIGFARGRIAPGEHVHTHNLATKDFARDARFCAEARPVCYYPPEQMRHFQGYVSRRARRDPQLHCGRLQRELFRLGFVLCAGPLPHGGLPARFPNVDGVAAFTHKAGCATAPGEPLLVLQRVLAGYAGIRTSPAAC